MTSIEYERSRTRMQWSLGILALAPTISGVQQVVLGVAGTPGDSQVVSSTVDGELRYANVFKMVSGPIILSQLHDVEDSPILTATLATVFVGGLARLLSWRRVGRPHPSALVAIALELGAVPAALYCRRRLASSRA